MAKSYRPKMLGGEIQRVLGELLIRGALKDPVFKDKIIGINSVDVSGDGSYASLYISAMTYTPGKELSEEDKKALLKALERAQGFIRSEIGKAVKLRHIPELRFSFDESYEYGMKMDRLLDSLK